MIFRAGRQFFAVFRNSTSTMSISSMMLFSSPMVAAGGKLAINLIGIQRVKPAGKDYPWKTLPMEENRKEWQKEFGLRIMRNNK